MKIAFLSISNGVIDRGSEVFVHELASHLTRTKEVTVFQKGKNRKNEYETIVIQGLPFIQHQGPATPKLFIGRIFYEMAYEISVLIFTFQCILKMRKKKYDWIVPLNGPVQALICRIFQTVYKYKILITGHAGIGNIDRMNILLGNPDQFIALSPTAYSWARSLSENVSFIPNGVNILSFSPQGVSKVYDLKRPVILCVSALLEYKRVIELIEAIKYLPSASLVLIGDGPLRREIENKLNKILPKRFTFYKYISPTEISSYYRGADAFALLSDPQEAFGMVYLEAMACNVPIITRNDVNRKAIVGDAGVYCDNIEASEIVQSIKNALQKKWGNLPREQAEKFSWKNITSKYEKVFSY